MSPTPRDYVPAPAVPSPSALAAALDAGRRPAEQRKPLATRRPTGRPSWPLILIAGGKKVGKSYLIAEASTSPVFERTFWVELGEANAADLYGSLPGADFELVETDGTFDDVVGAVAQVVDLGDPERPNLLAIDSVSTLWTLLVSEYQAIASARRGTVRPEITADQWNAANARWRDFLALLRQHHGPVVLTSRTDHDALKGGIALDDIDGKARTQKELAYDVDVVVQIPTARTYYLTGVRSLHVDVPRGGVIPVEDLTISGLLEMLHVNPETVRASA